jgi:hypothetical protein
MPKRRALSSFERGLAVCLSLVWLGAGALALYLALVHSRWGMGVAALAALIYGAAWLRVAALSRLLTWPELVAPWRRI